MILSPPLIFGFGKTSPLGFGISTKMRSYANVQRNHNMTKEQEKRIAYQVRQHCEFCRIRWHELEGKDVRLIAEYARVPKQMVWQWLDGERAEP